jgi:uncharacterized membrane protein YoaK (UPF0700 family)
LKLVATGFLAVFNNFQNKVTGNWTDAKTEQSQLLVQLQLIAFGPVPVFFLVLATRPLNTEKHTSLEMILIMHLGDFMQVMTHSY